MIFTASAAAPTTPPWIERPLAHAPAAGGGDDGVALFRAGTPTLLSHGGVPMPLDAGAIVLVDLAAPLYSEGAEDRLLTFGRGQLTHALGVGRDLLPVRLDPADPLTPAIDRFWGLLGELASGGLADTPVGWASADALCLLVAEIVGRGDVGARTSHGARSLHRAKRLIADNAHRAEFDVAGLAQAMGVSVRQLSALFGQAGSSPGRALAEHRLQMAKALLARPANARTAIASVAAACGFADPAYFTRCFKRRFGLLPRTARQLIASENQKNRHQ